MNHTYPTYYKSFKCTASACSDNCCIGWEIDIDADSLDRYMAQGGALGKRLHNSISLEGTPHFILQNERCPFLNGKNLCDIFTAMGENALCEICTQHPRFHEWFGNVKESGIGLCCEAAAELILLDSKPARFITAEIDELPSPDFEEEKLFNAMVTARSLLFSLLQNRSYSIGKRLAAALCFAAELQNCFGEENEPEEVLKLINNYSLNSQAFFNKAQEAACPISDREEAETWSKIFSFFLTLEPIDAAWQESIKAVKDNLPEILKQRQIFLGEYLRRDYEYEHLAVYFTYRYMLKSIFDGDVLSKIKLMVVSLMFISVIDTAQWQRAHGFSQNDRVQIAKNYSKEIEYCEENLESFFDESRQSKYFSAETLLKLINKTPIQI